MVNDSVSYVFYQLLGQVVVNGKAELAKQVNGKLYLMVKNESEFYKAFYYDPKADPNEKIGKGTKEFDLKLFTGNLILSSLQNGRNYLLDYSNGRLSDSYQKKGVLAVKKMQSVKGTTSYWQQECQQVVRNCTFSSLSPSYCGGTVNIVFSATCSWPQSTCGDTYLLVDSDEGVVCEDRWFPDPPEPIDTGGGEGGNGDGPDDGDRSVNKDIIDSLKGYKCAEDLLKQLPDLNTDIATLVKKTFGANSKIDLKFRVDNSLKGTSIDGRYDQFAGVSPNSDAIYTISLNPDVLEKSSKEYILVTMYHEALHAYIAYAKATLSADVFAATFGQLDFNGGRTLFRELNGHFELAATNYLRGLKDVIKAFNPSYDTDRAVSLAEGGIVELTPDKKAINDQERDTTKPGFTGTKCP